jgi:hypothetical protein
MCCIFHRDHFDCRYCGGRTILTPVMELLGELYADIFPFHPNTTDQGWDGLTCYYRALWERAGRPKPRFHEAWLAALEASKPRP